MGWVLLKVLPILLYNRNYAIVLLMIIKMKTPNAKMDDTSQICLRTLCLPKMSLPQIYCFPVLLFLFQIE